MNKTHYALVVILLGGALLLASLFAPQPNAPENPTSTTTNNTMAQPAAMSASRSSDAILDIEFKDLNDKFRNLQEWRGKLIVLNFWATWCGPCRHEIPGFNNLQKKYAAQNVQFIGLAYDDKAAVEQFLKVVPIDYQVLYGEDAVMDLSMEYGNMQSILPFTVFINAKGEVFHLAGGAISESATESILMQELQPTSDSAKLQRTGG